MNNFKVIIGTKEYWVSRSMAVVVFASHMDEYYNRFILAVKRGIGTPDYQGCWCAPCGYLDYNETLEDAAVRETFEETGLKLNKNNLKIFYIDSAISDHKQNVTIRFQYYLNNIEDLNLTNEYSEKNEVEEIKFINVKELNKYKWAFNHDKIITKYYSVK